MAEQKQSMNFNDIADSCRNISSLSGSFETTISQAQKAVGRITGNAWEGEAASNFQSEMNGLVGKLPTANQQLAYSVLYLTSVSDGYEALGDSTVNKLIDLVGGQSYIDGLNVSGLPDPDLTIKSESKKADDTTKTYEDENKKTDDSSSDSSSSDGSNSSSDGNDYSYSPGPSGGGDPTPQYEVSNLAGKTIDIPSSVKQGTYAANGYDFYLGDGKEMVWPEGSNQEAVAKLWKQQGSKFKNGIAVLNVNGKERYLIAVTRKFGVAGDCIDITLEDGTVVPAVIGHNKGNDTGSEWGHARTDGSVNILEFEVQRAKVMADGDPTTEKWDLEWDSKKSIKNIKNIGSILTTTA